MESSRFYLLPHVHACSTNRFWVFLDLRRDRYLCIHKDELVPIAPLIEGLTTSPAGENLIFEPSAIDAIATQLLNANLIAKRPRHLESANERSFRAQPPRPVSVVETGHVRLGPRLLLTALPLMMLACARADGYLRRKPIEWTVERVRKRNMNADDGATIDRFERTLRLVAAFRLFRPLYPRPYLCLFDCLAMSEFLAFYRIYPFWVFGVAADPFEAHCWIQVGESVLCDTTTHGFNLYTPILTV
jgi:hypothetical protein